MKVLHVIASLDPAYGGPAKVVRSLTESLKTKGHETAILSSDAGDVRVSTPIKRFYLGPFLERQIKKHSGRFELIHIHGLFNGLSRAAATHARKEQIPYVLTPFGTLSPYCLRKNGAFKRMSLFFGERANVEAASAVLFTSQSEKERALSVFNIPQATVIPNGIDLERFDQLPERGNFRRRFGILDSENLIVFIGRLQPIKGLEVFLTAFSDFFKNAKESWKLAIVGGDERGYRRTLEGLVQKLEIRNHVVFTGPLYDQEHLSALADTDLAVLPSFHENFGLAAAEAMACGKPVILSDQVDIWPVVQEKDCGQVGPATVEGMKGALCALAGRRLEWASMGARAKKWAYDSCRWDDIAEKVLEIYRRALIKNQ